MIETIENSYTSDEIFKKYIPVFTAACALICIVLFIGINLEGNLDSWDVYKKWGAPSASHIFDGSYWGLVSSNFLHTEIWHIIFNIYWLWILGKKIEFESNKIFYVFLILSSALISSVTQLAFSSSTGIGFSGIVYSFFGFIYINSRTVETYKIYLPQSTVNLFFLWIPVGIILTQLELWTIGNAAHIGGLIWGMTVAYMSRFNIVKQCLIGLVVYSVMLTSIFWNPFSVSWLSYQAYKLHDEQRIEEATLLYKKILSRDAKNKFASDNLNMIEVSKLSDEAYKLHKNKKLDEASALYNEILRRAPNNEFAYNNLKKIEMEKLYDKAYNLHAIQKYTEARKVYLQILEIDKNNEWAIENLKRLPAGK